MNNQLNQAMKDTMSEMMKASIDECRHELRHDILQQTKDLTQKQKRRIHKQDLEPKPPDYVQNNSSKHKWFKEEDDGKWNYLEWEITMDKWLCYNRIMKKERLAFAMSQLQGKAYKWWLHEKDDRRFYKEPAITTWESLKLILRSNYASKGYTSQKSPMKEVTSSRKSTFYSKKKTAKHSWFSEGIKMSCYKCLRMWRNNSKGPTQHVQPLKQSTKNQFLLYQNSKCQKHTQLHNKT
ncbi:hypothetical protein N665_0218s0111 [Sinapis alba]|nr:hypothetical protein N665_0218s0111 [Sinapis alba]